ncbi:LysM peptidoglycan-binding domain-containing protein [Dolosigranulum pigrum]|uniref:LysM peptidoglycan-binding domain-containing protein n=1 Tax=Dolosigranulum pigrum TaxID=29394 RepID=UPI0026B9CF20|nr:LysM domain-containing protein [Dolosigranulum pigrum]
MSKKDMNDKEELWSKKFDEEMEEADQDTSEHKKKKSKISPILTGSVALLGLLIVVMIFFYVYYRGRDGAQVAQTSDQVTLQENSNDIKDLNLKARDSQKEKEEKEKKAEEEKQEQEKKEKEQERKKQQREEQRQQEREAEQARQQEQQQQQQQQTQQQEQSNQQQQTQQTQQQQQSGGSSYTVQAGDNLYRIAVNHGMTLDELLQKNGLSANSTIQPGDTLQVN